ncbi:DUF6783 domain-containing protein [Fusicatenibacter sp.]
MTFLRSETAKSPTNWDTQPAKSLFQTRAR